MAHVLDGEPVSTSPEHALEHVPLVSDLSVVMAGLVPAIHALAAAQKTWMPGTRPGMTAVQFDRNVV